MARVTSSYQYEIRNQPLKGPIVIFYSGPSQIDGSPIVGIAVLKSKNAKTGNMVQTYIIRADMHPLEAIRSGKDDAICGDCKHRGSTCYVDVGKSVSAVYRAFRAGSYPSLDLSQVALALAGRKVRMGTYGDPAAIPADVWQQLLAYADGHTGYTHQWKQPYGIEIKSLVMASADTPEELDAARGAGWRTFRVRTASQPLQAREIMCPASDEAGKRRQCITCRACNGAGNNPSRASVAIIVHGLRKGAFAA